MPKEGEKKKKKTQTKTKINRKSKKVSKIYINMKLCRFAAMLGRKVVVEWRDDYGVVEEGLKEVKGREI